MFINVARVSDKPILVYVFILLSFKMAPVKNMSELHSFILKWAHIDDKIIVF